MLNRHKRKKPFSIIGLVYSFRGRGAIIFGAIGLFLVFISFAVPEPYKSIWYLQFIGRVGEVLATTAFLVYIIEQHTIGEFLTKDITISLIKDFFRYYLKKDEMKNVIVEFTRELNFYENLDEDIWKLYERHGIVELFNEPVREDLHIAYKYLGDVETSDNLIYVYKHWSFRAKNTAKQTLKEDLSKLINKNGLVHCTKAIITDPSFPNTHAEIVKYIEEKTKLSFLVTISGASGLISKIKKEPVYFHEKEFDKEIGLPKNVQLVDQNNFFLVYSIDDYSRVDGKKYLSIELFLHEMIQPGDSLGIEFDYQAIVEDFNVSTFDFISYTLGFCFSIDFGEKFKTDIEDRIIGSGFSSNKSDKGLIYSGWILPHSSISCAWTRKPS